MGRVSGAGTWMSTCSGPEMRSVISVLLTLGPFVSGSSARCALLIAFSISSNGIISNSASGLPRISQSESSPRRH